MFNYFNNNKFWTIKSVFFCFCSMANLNSELLNNPLSDILSLQPTSTTCKKYNAVKPLKL